MMRATLCFAIALAACGNQERIALELQGDFPTATTVEVLFAAPYAYPKGQRTTPAAGAGWTLPPDARIVHYLAQRSAPVEIPTQGVTSGMRIQLASVDNASFLPIVALKDAQGAVLAIGAYHADEVFAIDQMFAVTPEVTYEPGKLKIYTVPLEAVKEAPYVAMRPTAPTPNQLMIVPCASSNTAMAPPSGFVWRRTAKQEMRFLIPVVDGTDNAEDRLAAPDLDCDQHSAGINGGDRENPGDRGDCDDLSPQVFKGHAEACNGVDDDCDGLPATTITTPCPNACAFDGKTVCDEIGNQPDRCAHTQCLGCRISTVTSPSGGAAKRPCPLADQLTISECQAKRCILTLAYVDPMWQVLIGATAPTMGVGMPVMIDNTNATTPKGLQLSVSSMATFAATQTAGGVFVLSVQVISNGVLQPTLAYTYGLGLTAPQMACDMAGTCNN